MPIRPQKRRTFDAASFLDYFSFPDLQAAVSEPEMSGVLCAIFAGDEAMLRRLGSARADVNRPLQGLDDVGYFASQTPLMAALKSQQDLEVVKAILEMRADLEAESRSGKSRGWPFKCLKYAIAVDKLGENMLKQLGNGRILAPRGLNIEHIELRR